jgi:N-glycosylase/DNA lyase
MKSNAHKILVELE